MFTCYKITMHRVTQTLTGFVTVFSSLCYGFPFFLHDGAELISNVGKNVKRRTLVHHISYEMKDNFRVKLQSAKYNVN